MQTALRQSRESHLHILGETCPVCEQPIPNDRADAVRARAEEREHAITQAAEARAAQQLQAERAGIEAAASAAIEQLRAEQAEALSQLAAEAALKEAAAREAGKTEAEAALLQKLEIAEQARRDAAAAVEALKEAVAAREAAAHEEGARTAQEAARARIEEAETARAHIEATLRTQLMEAAEATAAAEEAKVAVATQLEKLKTDNEAAMMRAAQEAAVREQQIRTEAVRAAEEAVQGKLAATEQARQAAEQIRAETESALREQLAVATTEINQQREALEKDKMAAVNAERAQRLEMQMRLEGQLQDMQRQIVKKTADELGEGAELELYEVLKGAFEEDRMRRVKKGTPGADIVHEVVHNGKVCGKIVYDSKNRGNWQTAYATKLREDQIAEKADHAILSSNKFPGRARQLHIQDHVIVACPARVLVLAELLRSDIIRKHDLRVSNEAREEKAAELYDFITSERCSQLLDSVETLVRKLEQVEVDEQKAHDAIWRKRGNLLKAVLKANGNLSYEIDRIIGTAETSGVADDLA